MKIYKYVVEKNGSFNSGISGFTIAESEDIATSIVKKEYPYFDYFEVKEVNVIEID